MYCVLATEKGRRYAMLVFLAITLSTVHGWVIPPDDKASFLSSHESAITGGVDGARDRRQLSHLTSSCHSSCDSSCDWFGRSGDEDC